MTLFFQSTFKGNFVAGFDKYVARTFGFGHPPPDVYWNPRTGQWLTYGAQKFRFIDENLPSLGDLDPLAQAGDVFDKITQQWSALPPPQHASAVWDGRQHKWVLAQPLGGTGNGDPHAAARAEYERKLAILNEDHRAGKLTDGAYEQQTLDLWKEYKDRL